MMLEKVEYPWLKSQYEKAILICFWNPWYAIVSLITWSGYQNDLYFNRSKPWITLFCMLYKQIWFVPVSAILDAPFRKPRMNTSMSSRNF